MKPYYDHAGISLHLGDCREVLAGMPDGCVQTCVTSPPYYGLRDYGTADWEGGDAACDHAREVRPLASRPNLTGAGIGKGGAYNDAQDRGSVAYRDTCGKCGARRVDRQIGLEATPAAFVAEMVAVFRAVRRVLRDDGTCWINLGDSYAANMTGNGGYSAKSTLSGFTNPMTKGRIANESGERRRIEHCAKPKDLIGMPWRVAFALQEDGWYLRSDIIWHKPNPMPESVADRPTRSHEYIFLLSKSARYYYDAAAIAEPALSVRETIKMPDGWDTGPGSHGAFHRNGREKGQTRTVGPNSAMRVDRVPETRKTNTGAAEVAPLFRNKRDVWTIATQPYPDAHYATFPAKLIEPCILAGAPIGGVVLDPFAGSGTTLMVAKRFGRRAIGIELNPADVEKIERRLQQDVLPLGA